MEEAKEEEEEGEAMINLYFASVSFAHLILLLLSVFLLPPHPAYKSINVCECVRFCVCRVYCYEEKKSQIIMTITERNILVLTDRNE